MRSLGAVRAFLFTVVAISLAGMATAQAYAQPKPPAEKIGRIGPAQATSGCIGSASSPVCSTETLLACFARAEPALCAKVGADARAVGRQPGAIEYWIERVSEIRAEDITEDLRDIEWFKAGYTLVELRRRGCAAAGCTDESWEDMQVYLRPRGALWEIVAWRGDLEQESAPEVPENFRPTGRTQ
jgi:hypothetical protein